MNNNIVEVANDGHSEHRAKHLAGDGAHCGREECEETSSGPNRWRKGRERGGRRTRLREKSSAVRLLFFSFPLFFLRLFFFFFLPTQGVPIGRKITS